MRTITEIKENIIYDFMNDVTVAKSYGFTPGDSFETYFSKVSIESILFYIFACAAWVLENLLAEHQKEVDLKIEAMTPHRPKWYRDKTLAFMMGCELIRDSDDYDTTDMSDDEIATAKIIKHAVAVEQKESSILLIKVAGENAGNRQPISIAQQTALEYYISEIKDAGVRVVIVNKAADTYNCEVDVYYNPMLEPDSVKMSCETMIKKHIENLPFNGEYSNMALIDNIQQVAGVKIAELKSASRSDSGIDGRIIINAKCIPSAGYFTPGIIIINMIAYE